MNMAFALLPVVLVGAIVLAAIIGFILYQNR